MTAPGGSVLWGLCLVVTWSLPARAGAQAMVPVPGGWFVMGSDSGHEDERPVHRVRLGPYAIDRYETTQAQYTRCVEAGACRPPRAYPVLQGPDLPVVGVTWRDADTYCRWAGKRLPSEAEWERAARGTDGRVFPWGRDLDCTRANFGNFGGAGLCARTNPGRIMKVGSRPAGASPVGAQDMAGNAWEWVADDHLPYPWRPRPAPEETGRSGQGAAGERLKVVRGGSCCSYFIMPRSANRLAFPQGYADQDIGFRCARSAPRR